MGDIWNVWVYDMGRGTLSRLTFEGDNRDPVWADSKHVVYGSFRNGHFGIYWKRISGNEAEEQLTATPTEPWVTSCSGDGQRCTYDLGPSAGLPGIQVLPMAGEHKQSAPILAEPTAEAATISPDGKWVAYDSAESGRSEVYVRPFPSGASKWQISNEGGIRPKWSANGRELFFRKGSLRSASSLMSVQIQTETVFAASQPKQIFPFRYEQAGHDYAVMPDGQHFICIKEPQAGPTEVAVILNWASELSRK